MKDIIKKYWFVMLIGALLLGMVGYQAAEQFKNVTFSKKTADGKDVVFEYQGENVTADDIYAAIFEINGENLIINLYENLVYKSALEPTADQISEAKLAKDNLIVRAKQQYGEQYKEALQTILLPYGYRNGVDDLYDFYLTEALRQQVEENYITTHLDLWNAYVKAQNPRLVSHILIKMDNPDKPTEEEQKRLEAAKKAVAESTESFAELAKKYSEDTGSKELGGKLGLTDKDNAAEFVTEFHQAIYQTEVGKRSAWFKSKYGYHLIQVDSQDLADIIKDDSFLDLYFAYYPNLSKMITVSAAADLNITISGNPTLENALKEYYDVKEAR